MKKQELVPWGFCVLFLGLSIMAGQILADKLECIDNQLLSLAPPHQIAFACDLHSKKIFGNMYRP